MTKAAMVVNSREESISYEWTQRNLVSFVTAVYLYTGTDDRQRCLVCHHCYSEIGEKIADTGSKESHNATP